MDTLDGDLSALDFTAITECIDPDHELHAPFHTATWLIRERACPTRFVGGGRIGGCPGATLLLCDAGYDAYRASGDRTCGRCGHHGPPPTWIEQATPIRSHPGFDTYLCPVDRCTFDAWQGTTPYLLHTWTTHHRAHLEHR